MRPKISWEDFIKIALEWRSIEQGCECKECQGSGVVLYGDTSTYHKGVGGQCMTIDVCDKCWGRGDRTNLWPSRLSRKP